MTIPLPSGENQQHKWTGDKPILPYPPAAPALSSVGAADCAINSPFVPSAAGSQPGDDTTIVSAAANAALNRCPLRLARLRRMLFTDDLQHQVPGSCAGIESQHDDLLPCAQRQRPVV